MSEKALVIWKVDSAPALWLPKLDAIALDCLEPNDAVARRWLLGSGRYLGRLGHGGHLLWSNREFAARLSERTREQAQRGEIKTHGWIQVTYGKSFEEHGFMPGERSEP
jgi:hypothetical protein